MCGRDNRCMCIRDSSCDGDDWYLFSGPPTTSNTDCTWSKGSLTQNSTMELEQQ